MHRSLRQSQHLMLRRPGDGRVEQAGDADPVRQSAIDSGRDKIRCKEGERDRHVDMSLAAGLPCRNVVERCNAGLDLGQPLPTARDRGNEPRPGVGADRKNLCRRGALGDKDFAMASMRRLAW